MICYFCVYLLLPQFLTYFHYYCNAVYLLQTPIHAIYNVIAPVALLSMLRVKIMFSPSQAMSVSLTMGCCFWQ